jgi:Mn2+/Fe2+ NRAMP family transporter
MANFAFITSRLLPFLMVFGPATITAISDNDAAGVATYSLAGAQFGYAILFILFLVTLLLAATQEMGVRIGIVTGKGLADIIRERYGVVVSTLVFLCLCIANLGTIVADFAGLKAVVLLFHLPLIPIIIGFIALSFLFVSKGSYQTNQKIFLVGIVLYFSYVFSAFKSSPDWFLALKSTFIPTNVPLTKEFIFTSIAVLGTTITPWGQFFIQSYIVDKKLPVDHLKYARFETYFGALLTNFFSFFMIIATAGTLFVHHITLVSGEQAALAIRPFAGELAGLLFGIGLLNAALMGIVIISLSTAYAFAEFFGIEGSLDVPFERGKIFYGIFLAQLIAAGCIIMIPQISLFQIVNWTQSLNGILLPVIFYFLLNITNNKELMGQYINNRWYNYFIVIASIVIILASLATIASAFIKF